MRSSLYRLILATLLAVAMVAVFISCEDRGTNLPERVSVDEGFPSPSNHDFDTSLMLQINNPTRQLQMLMYVPAVSITPINDTVGDPEPVPLLVLLAPQNETEYYYFNNGLKQVADELIATGAIEPMAILTVSNDRRFVGGYFYSGYYEITPYSGSVTPNPIPSSAEDTAWYTGRGFAAGDWDEIVSQDVLEFAYGRYPFLIDSATWRGIGGIGQGGYGALRASILSQKFTSVSALDAPLDFDGADGNSGFISLMPDVLTEQGLTGQDFADDVSIESGFPLTRMFVGGASAFSPHDTGLFVGQQARFNQVPLITVLDTARLQVNDSASLITSVVTAADRSLHFHLPFDFTSGAVNTTIWDLWMDNNPEDMINARGGIPSLFAGVDLWFGYSPQHRFGFGNQTKSFADWFIAQGFPGNIKGLEEYNGYDDFPATWNQYVKDFLGDMLIFHNNKFREGE